MTTIDFPKLFSQAAFEAYGKAISPVDASTVIAGIGLDSVAIMELVSIVEERVQIRLPDDELASVRTVGDLGALIQRLVPEGTRVTFPAAGSP